jgi:hypothetical protein
MTVKRPNRKVTDDDIVAALLETGGNLSAASRALGITRKTIRERKDRLAEQGRAVPETPWNPSTGQPLPDGMTKQSISGGRVSTREIFTRPLPPPGQVATYLLTAATNNTDLHAAFWANLQALAAHYKAHGPVEILVRRIGYNLNAWRKLGADTEVDGPGGDDAIHYAPELLPHVCDERVELAPGIHWAGDAPSTATAVSPLSGYDTFTGEASGVFGATKLEMRSIATMRGQPAKHIISTGVVTQRNYSETKVGQKADWNHVFGATLVEVESDGTWFMRPLVADDCGTICDLNITVRDGEAIEGPNMDALTPGDVHVADLEPAIQAAIYGPEGMTDTLQPGELHHHDLHDHKARSHHDERNPFRRLQLHYSGEESVEDEVAKDAAFLSYAARPWMRQVVIGSNHDEHMHRWLKDANWKSDPPNMLFYLRAAHRTCQAIKEGDEGFHLLEWACREKGAPDDVIFLRQDQSWLVHDIECGLHGDRGPNGSRGSARSLSRIGAKTNIGHSHTPAIIDGCWQAGVTAGDVDEPTLDYAYGPSAWSRTLIGTYANGKRTLITMRGLRWRAARSTCSLIG